MFFVFLFFALSTKANAFIHNSYNGEFSFNDLWFTSSNVIDRTVNIYNISSGTLFQTISKEYPIHGFGKSTLFYENYLFVSSPWVENNVGVVYVYKYDNFTWLDHTVIEIPAGFREEGAYFGLEMKLEDDYILIAGFGVNRVFKFIFSDGKVEFLDTFKPNVFQNSRFGHSICVGDGVVVVGAISENNEGCAYVFDSSSYSLIQKIYYPRPQHTNVNFGYDCDFDNGILVIGSQRGTFGGGDAVVYEQVGNQFEFKQILSPSVENDILGGQFGVSVSVHNRDDYCTVLVGGPELLDMRGFVNGAVSVFFKDHNNFTQQETFYNENAIISNGFGLHVYHFNATHFLTSSKSSNLPRMYGNIGMYTKSPTPSPTKNPTLSPTMTPTAFPTKSPTKEPTRFPSTTPTFSPSDSPTEFSISFRTPAPTQAPTSNVTEVGETSSSITTNTVIIVSSTSFSILLCSCCCCIFVLCGKRRRRDKDYDNSYI